MEAYDLLSQRRETSGQKRAQTSYGVSLATRTILERH